MTYVITQSCCNDAICVAVCPVDAIHPTPEEPEYATTDQLYIDPRSCVDCNACAEVCPVRAIHREVDLPAPMAAYAGVNAGFFAVAGA